LLALVASLTMPARAQAPQVNFETVPVRPLALVPGAQGTRLYAVNTPDSRLEVFEVGASGLVHLASTPVGLDPVAIQARTETELWVVNHLSDSVSVVDASTFPPRVVRTLLVGDEPWDVVFGGTRASPTDPFLRAFVSAARRGQNHPESPDLELKTPGVGRADVWVFDAADPGSALGGTPLTIVRLFGDKPRPLAVTADGTTVYAGVFHSGNRTTALNAAAVCDGGAARGPCDILNADATDPPIAGTPGEIGPNKVPILPGGLPAPNTDLLGNPQPEVGLVVQWNAAAAQWQDGLGRNWNGAVPFSLPDLDVFAIDATADPPAQSAQFAGVGSVLFGMLVVPDGRVLVSNTEARNLVRFEGPGGVRGRLHEARVTILDGAQVKPRHLNKHIPYASIPMPADVKPRSLSTPLGMALGASGELLVTAFGSSKLGILDLAALDADSFTPDAADHVPLSGGGPAGVVYDAALQRAYVYTRFQNQISIVDLASRTELDTVALHDPEPAVVRDGRSILYDAQLGSSNGEASCASCHVFGDKDELSWDLGDPSGIRVANPNPFAFVFEPPLGEPKVYHPLKGPMATQTLRGMAGNGPLHWRGDRSDAFNPGGSAFDDVDNFEEFNVAFEGLLGRDEGAIPAALMTAFSEFAMTIVPPPSPIRELTDLDTPSQAGGRAIYFNETTDGRGPCNLCHELNPALGFFGTDGFITFEGETQHFKIPHTRNAYDKVGAFGVVAVNTLGNAGFDLGDQIRGVGVLHDGSAGSIHNFLDAMAFAFEDLDGNGDGGEGEQAQVEDFILAFPSNLAPIVGQQVTLRAGSGADVHARIDLLRASAQDPFAMKGAPDAKECELVVRGRIAGRPRGWRMLATGPDTGKYQDDLDALIDDTALRALAATAGQELTFLCAYPGGGVRLGTDRDLDGIPDGKQCGDGNADGVLGPGDLDATRRQLAAQGALLAPDKCNVHGAPGGGPGSCDMADAVVLARALAGLATPLQICGPA
jgi:YVTN family beta-propeller protein